MVPYCSDPIAPTDEDLLRYIFGEGSLSESSKQHLEHCSFCQQQLSDYTQTNNFLLPALYRSQCPNGTQLTLYCANALPTDEIFAIDEHLRECFLCTEEANTIRHELTHFVPFPEPETRSLKQIALQTLKRIVAQPMILQPGMNVRQDPSAPSWPRQYQGEGFDILFQLSRMSNDQLKLVGFFVCSTVEQLKVLEGLGVDLYHAPTSPIDESAPSDKPEGQPVLSTTVDDLGNFAFAPISSGNYTAIVHLPTSELVLEGLNVT